MEDNNREDNEYEVSLPYPEPRVERENSQYARLLLRDYAGRISELTGMLQYSYNSYILQKEYPEIAEIMRQIARVDQVHLRLLGETITELGVSPRYWNTRRYWSGANISYRRMLSDILQTGISNENTLIERYREQRRQIKDKYIDALLQRIILNHRLHRRTMRRLYRQYIGPLSSNTEQSDDDE